MGLLNSMINIIGKGVAKGIGDIVEKTVTEAVKPAATKFAQKQADLIDSVTKNIEEANKSIQEAGEAAEQAAAQDPEQLKMAMEMLRRNAHKAAEEIEKAASESDATLTDEEVMAKWDTILPNYPKWTCGGNHFELEEDDLGDDGKCVRFYLNASEASWIAYQAILVANGFRTKYRGDTAFWYKEINGEYPAVHLFHIDGDACEIILIYYMETKEDILEASKL